MFRSHSIFDRQRVTSSGVTGRPLAELVVELLNSAFAGVFRDPFRPNSHGEP